MNFDKKCNLLIIGDATVGKTCILRRFAHDKFTSNYISTVGIDFFTKDVILNDKKIHIKIWDTAGQERYRSLTQGFFRKAEGIIIVYDITNESSFNNLKFWIDSIESNTNSQNSKIPAIIIGNKIDILERKVDKVSAENFAKNKNYKYFEVSAKTGIYIDESIKFLIKKVLKEGNENEKKKEDKKDTKNIEIKKNDNNNDKTAQIKKCCNIK